MNGGGVTTKERKKKIKEGTEGTSMSEHDTWPGGHRQLNGNGKSI